MNENGCWLFGGYIDPKTGYGQINIFGTKRAKVHRLIGFCCLGIDLVFFTDTNIQICHTCDVRHCINPLHLWRGTKSDNFRDAVKKGRWHNQYYNNLEKAND